MITKANLEEAKLIYKKHMEFDFPDDELPEYDRYVKLTKENIHNVYLYKVNNQNLAYFITVENNNNILITHLAVMKEFRSQGRGKVFLEEIKKYFKDKNMLIVEVEAEARANNDDELNIIKRRKNYYLKSDFKQCENMNYVLWGVPYDILIYVPNRIQNYSNNQIKDIMENIYCSLGLDNSKLIIDI